MNGPHQKVELTTAKTLVELAPTGTYDLNGRAAYCAVGIFGAYQKDEVRALQKVVSSVLDTVFPLQKQAN